MELSDHNTYVAARLLSSLGSPAGKCQRVAMLFPIYIVTNDHKRRHYLFTRKDT